MKVALTHATSNAIYQMLSKFAEIGILLTRIKSFVETIQNEIIMNLHSQILQTFADSLGELLMSFSLKIAKLQRRNQSCLQVSKGSNPQRSTALLTNNSSLNYI